MTRECCGREILRFYFILYMTISWCTHTVIGFYFSSVCQPSLLVGHTCVHLMSGGGHFYVFFFKVTMLFWACVFKDTAPCSSIGLLGYCRMPPFLLIWIYDALNFTANEEGRIL